MLNEERREERRKREKVSGMRSEKGRRKILRKEEKKRKKNQTKEARACSLPHFLSHSSHFSHSFLTPKKKKSKRPIPSMTKKRKILTLTPNGGGGGVKRESKEEEEVIETRKHTLIACLLLSIDGSCSCPSSSMQVNIGVNGIVNGSRKTKKDEAGFLKQKEKDEYKERVQRQSFDPRYFLICHMLLVLLLLVIIDRRIMTIAFHRPQAGSGQFALPEKRGVLCR